MVETSLLWQATGHESSMEGQLMRRHVWVRRVQAGKAIHFHPAEEIDEMQGGTTFRDFC
jgi:hypothetical protein